MTRAIVLLVVLLVVWRLVRSRLTAVAKSAPQRRPAEPDPCVVLGIPSGASGAEIQRAYRERVKEYHPDRVADLGPELRELAHRKTVEIQQAWQALRHKAERD